MDMTTAIRPVRVHHFLLPHPGHQEELEPKTLFVVAGFEQLVQFFLVLLMISGWLTVIVPWLSTCAVKVRGPPLPARIAMVPPGAFVSVPAVSDNVDEYVEPALDS